MPVVGNREELARVISGHQVVIVCGETGSGKTTQLPKICLTLGRGISGCIGHTQPRRVAARSVASRIAFELKTELGGAVGYKVRFHDKISPHPNIQPITTLFSVMARARSARFCTAGRSSGNSIAARESRRALRRRALADNTVFTV